MRYIFLIAACALITGAAEAQSYTYEQGTYRKGPTYAVSEASDAQGCAAACGQEAACLAWNYQRETGLGPARCELKSSVGAGQPNPLMVSGIAPRIANQGADTTPRPNDGLLGGARDTGLGNAISRSAPAPALIVPPTQKPLATPQVQIILPVPAPIPAQIQRPLTTPDVQIILPAQTSTPVPPVPAAGSVLTPIPSTQQTAPYKQLRARIYPEYSVTRDSITPPEEPTIIENLDLDTEDLAGDIGEPVIVTNEEQRRRQREQD